MDDVDSWIMHASSNVNKYLLELDWLFWSDIGEKKSNYGSSEYIFVTDQVWFWSIQMIGGIFP